MKELGNSGRLAKVARRLQIYALLPGENYRWSMPQRGWTISEFRQGINFIPLKRIAKGNMQFGSIANIGSVFAGKMDMLTTWR
jgi:hypothetical protein